MEEAIVRPGLVTGAAFEPFTVTPELVNIIINEAGDRTDQLPLMQHALMRTWKNAVADTKFNKSSLVLTVLNYSDAGRIKDALNRDADALAVGAGRPRSDRGSAAANRQKGSSLPVRD